MKKTFTILVAILFTALAWGQTPQKMSYQAVIRNSSSVLVSNTQVGIRISLLKDSTNGTVVYTETQTPTTNANGLVTIEIGGGVGFDNINWATGIYFIQIETDITGGTNYTITGTSQLLSVPYALYAKTAENITGSVTETDPIFIASPSNGITNANITNWNSSFSWGNHATAGYLTSFSEVDPKIGANISGYSPKWNGTSLVTGSVYQDGAGNVGLGTVNPSQKLDVQGYINASSGLCINGDCKSSWFSISPWINNGTDYYHNSGKIGIGTTTPTTTLDVNGIITATGGNSTNWNTSFGWGNHASAGYLTSFSETDPKIGINTSGYSPKWDGTALVTGSVYQDGSGNVGIGTASPSVKLQVNGNAIIDNVTGSSTLTIASTSGATPFLNFGGSSGGIIQTPQNTLSLRFGSNASASSVDFEPAKVTFRTGGFAGFERLTINSSGNIGIGTTTPSNKLEVIGTIKGDAIVKSGGTASQFLKADGSVDNNTYITAINEAADEFSATASQTSFTLTQVPSTTSKIKMYINGIRISNTAYSNSGTSLTYIPANNGSYSLANGDRIQFDYYY